MSATVAEPGTQTVTPTTTADAVEAWLHASPAPDAPVLWRPWGRDGTPVRSADALAALVAALAIPGAWGVVERAEAAVWGQTMRVPGGYIVEVNGEPGPESFARRVVVPGAERETFAIASEAAAVLWSWLRGGVPEGLELRELRAGE